MKTTAIGDWALWAICGSVLTVACLAPVGEAGPSDFPEPKPHAFTDDIMPFGYARLLHGTAESPRRQRAERRIDAGLKWLAAHQSPDGRFAAHDFADICQGKPIKAHPRPGRGKAEHDVGASALAVSAFLHAGYTHRGAHPYARVVRRGLRWLGAQQNAEGVFGDRRNERWIYGHAFTTYALVNAYGMTGSALMRSTAQSGLDVLAALEVPGGGGWGYGVQRRNADASVTAAALLSIQTARSLGLIAGKVSRKPPLRVSTSRTPWAWYGRVTDREFGRAPYNRNHERPRRYGEDKRRFPARFSEGPSAAALLFFSRAAGPPKAPDAARWFSLVRDTRPRWLPNTGTVDLMYWWYGAMAMHAVPERKTAEWLEDVETALDEGQRRDTTVCHYAGSWDPRGAWGGEGGRVYATAVALLTLMADRAAPMGHGLSEGLDAEGIERLQGERRTRALRSLEEHPGLDGFKALTRAMDSEDVRVRRLAVVTLGRLGHRVEKRGPVNRIVKLAEADPSPAVRRAALWALGRFGDRHKRLRSKLKKWAKELERPAEKFLADVSRARALAEPHPALVGLLRHVRDPDMFLDLASERGFKTGAPEPTEAMIRARALAIRLGLPVTLQDPVGRESRRAFRDLFGAAGSWRDRYDALLALLDDPASTYAARLELLGSGLRAAKPDVTASKKQRTEARMREAVLRIAFVHQIRRDLGPTAGGAPPADVSREACVKQARALIKQAHDALRDVRGAWDQVTYDPTRAEAAMLWLETDYLAAWFGRAETGEDQSLRLNFDALDTALWVFDGTRTARVLMARKARQLRDFAPDVTDPSQRASLYEGVLMLLDHAASGDPRDPPERHLTVSSYGARAETCIEARRIGPHNFMRRGRGFHRTIAQRVPDLGADSGDGVAILPLARLLNLGGDQRVATQLLATSAKRATIAGHSALAKRCLDLRERIRRGR